MKQKSTSSKYKPDDKRAKDIAKRMKEIRLKNELTQVQFADIVGLSSPAVGAMENSLYLPNLDVLTKIKEHFGFDYNYVLDGEKKSPTEDVEALQLEIDRLKKMVDKLL